MRCFLCDAEYDNEKRIDGIEIYSKRKGKRIYIDHVSDSNGMVFRLCPRCFKPFIYGALFREERDFSLEYRFEEDVNEHVEKS